MQRVAWHPACLQPLRLHQCWYRRACITTRAASCSRSSRPPPAARRCSCQAGTRVSLTTIRRRVACRCIGCRNCNNVCPQTFGMEEEWGRARVMQQGVDTESKLQEAIDTCPVSCIHWVSKHRVHTNLRGRRGRKGVRARTYALHVPARSRHLSCLSQGAVSSHGKGGLLAAFVRTYAQPGGPCPSRAAAAPPVCTCSHGVAAAVRRCR